MTRPPLPPEMRYWIRTEDRQHSVNAIFDRSAQHYDRACDIMSFGSGQSYRRQALQRAGVQPGMKVLDVGTGTGLLARELATMVGPTGQVVGLDPSMMMMAEGRSQGTHRLVQGVGECLPFADARFDFVTMGYALRHVPDLDQTFGEFARVLRPGGCVLLLEITKPASMVGAALARAYFGSIVPWLARVGTGSGDASHLMRFYWDTIAQCVPPDIVLSSLRGAAFAAKRTVSFGLFSEYAGIKSSRGRLDALVS